MLLTPVGVSSFGLLADAFFGSAEYEADVLLRMLLLDEQMLLPVSSEEPTLGLDYEFLAGGTGFRSDDEVRSVTSNLCGSEILNDLILVFERHSCFEQFLGNAFF